MLKIFICEDNYKQRSHIESIVYKHIMSTDFDMRLVLSTSTPVALLEYVKTHMPLGGIYILDVDLQSAIDGIELAAEIKKLDVSAVIVFITSHLEMVGNTFELKVEAMEYILKASHLNNIEQRLIECINIAYERISIGKHPKVKHFTVKMGAQQIKVPLDDILYFETSPSQRNKILLHRVNGLLEFYGVINDLTDIDPKICQCHRSYVVNINHVMQINSAQRTLELSDGTVIPASRRRVKELNKLMK